MKSAGGPRLLGFMVKTSRRRRRVVETSYRSQTQTVGLELASLPVSIPQMDVIFLRPFSKTTILPSQAAGFQFSAVFVGGSHLIPMHWCFFVPQID